MRISWRVLPIVFGLFFVGPVSCDEEDDSSGEEMLEDGEGCYDEEDDSVTAPGDPKECECQTGPDAEKICLASGEFTVCLCDGGW